jgi:S-DNA-T family DNA segregation ATPase FtsK/SpoIIIE
MTQITDADRLIGAVAFEHVLLKFKPLTDDPEFRGAFHVLSGFTPEQLVAFIECSEAEPTRAAKLHIQFPGSELRSYRVSEKFLVDESAVNIRNRPRASRVAVVAELESDVGTSLADSDRTDASDLKDKAIAYLWIDSVTKQVQLTLLAEERRKAEAMVKGLFDTGRCPTAKVGDYLRDVLSQRQKGEPILLAAGKALIEGLKEPLGLLLHSDNLRGIRFLGIEFLVVQIQVENVSNS